MPVNEKKILNEIDAAMAFAEGFVERLKTFRDEISKGEQPKRVNKAQEAANRTVQLYLSKITKKTFRN